MTLSIDSNFESARVSRPVGLTFPTLCVFVVLAVWSWWYLGLSLELFVPDFGYSSIATEFFSRAFSPAIQFEGNFKGYGWDSVPTKAFFAALYTIRFAAFALSLSILFGVLLGCLGSQYFHEALRGPAQGSRMSWMSLFLLSLARLIAASLRSIHELIWAVLFLAAFGLSELTAGLAIAIPYGGILGKVFSETIDEAPRQASEAILESGGSGPQAIFFGILPLCWSDLSAYLLYRYECAVRSSAVLGFFGLPSLGYFISASFENLYYGEVWTYLYTLILVVILIDLFSRNLRQGLICAEPIND